MEFKTIIPSSSFMLTKPHTMWSLSKMLLAIVDVALLSGFTMGAKNPKVLNISHLFFADNALIFCEANPDYIPIPRKCFLCYEPVSESKVNLAKSKIVCGKCF